MESSWILEHQDQIQNLFKFIWKKTAKQIFGMMQKQKAEKLNMMKQHFKRCGTTIILVIWTSMMQLMFLTHLQVLTQLVKTSKLLVLENVFQQTQHSLKMVKKFMLYLFTTKQHLPMILNIIEQLKVATSKLIQINQTH